MDKCTICNKRKWFGKYEDGVCDNCWWENYRPKSIMQPKVDSILNKGCETSNSYTDTIITTQSNNTYDDTISNMILIGSLLNSSDSSIDSHCNYNHDHSNSSYDSGTYDSDSSSYDSSSDCSCDCGSCD